MDVPCTMSAPRPSRDTDANALPMSLGLRASKRWTRTPAALAVSSMTLTSSRRPGSVGSQRTATHETFGTASRRSWRRLGPSSANCEDSPVMLPAGRARLDTKPSTKRLHIRPEVNRRLRGQETYLVYLRCRLRFDVKRRKRETGSENKSDPPHGRLGGEYWLESSRPELWTG